MTASRDGSEKCDGLRSTPILTHVLTGVKLKHQTKSNTFEILSSSDKLARKLTSTETVRLELFVTSYKMSTRVRKYSAMVSCYSSNTLYKIVLIKRILLMKCTLMTQIYI